MLNNLPIQLLGDDVWNPHQKEIRSVCFSDDSKYLAILLSDRFQD